ncbi:MAG: hypothetical protein M1169_06835 [Firmicutes bacterium]|nr:hypothetical protein [Bacillota bacterium]
MAMDKITGKVMGGITGFAKKVTLNLVYDFIDQRTKEIKDELKEHKLENAQQFAKLEERMDRFEAGIRKEMVDSKTEIKQEMTDFKTEIKQEMTDFKTETLHRINTLEMRMDKLESEVKTEFRSLNQRIDQLNMRLDSIMGVLLEKLK